MDKNKKAIKTKVKEEKTEGGTKMTFRGVIAEIIQVKASELLGVIKWKIVFEDGAFLFVNGINGIECWNWVKDRQVEVNFISNAAGTTILSIDPAD